MIMPDKDEVHVMTTGGQVDDMVMALVGAAYDKEPEVRDVIHSSLAELGSKQPTLVLSSCHAFLHKHAKLPVGHRVLILRVIENIVKASLNDLQQEIAVEIIKLASAEMTQSKDVVPDWQKAASRVLVAMGSRFCTDVMEELLHKFQPGMLPHFFVVETLASLATSNVFGMLPFLKGCLGTMLPMLGMAKHDNMRWVLSTALARFCEAIIDYIANIEKAPDPAVKKEAFTSEVNSAFDILLTVWIQSRESKLRIAVVDALGHMAYIISPEKLQDSLPKLLQTILVLYRKHTDAYDITQGLCRILDAATQAGSSMLENHFDQLLGALFPQLCQTVDYSNPSTVKNHNEVLRCFAVLAQSFCDRLVTFLLMKLEPVHERARIGVLSVLRHLINSSGEHMAGKKALVLSGLKIVLHETSNKVKKVLAQTIVAMGHHSYLDLEGGEEMINFIVRQCALPVDSPAVKRSPDPDYVSNDALRSMCENVLQLLATTVEHMEHVLWPYLLECLLQQETTEAMGPLCRCIAHLANKRRAHEKEGGEEFAINYNVHVNIPSPAILLARLIVMAGIPRRDRTRGVHVLTLLQAVGPLISEHVVTLWDTVLPQLVQQLQDLCQLDPPEWSQEKWEELLLKFLSKSLALIPDEDWVTQLADALSQHIPLYADSHEEKSFLYKALGRTLRQSGRKATVERHLTVIFDTVQFANAVEREGCAVGVGFTANAHLDLVLNKLEIIGKTDTGKKSSFLGFIKEAVHISNEMDEKVKATVLLCYGYMAQYAPPNLIVSRLESTISRVIMSQLSHTKDSVVKHSLLRAVDLIARAMHPDHLKQPHTFALRGELLRHMMEFIRQERHYLLSNERRALAMTAAASLLKLEPKLSEAETTDLVKASLDCVLPLPAGGASTKKGKEETYEEHVENHKLMEQTTAALRLLLIDVLQRDMSPSCLEAVLQALQPWLKSELEHERERAAILTHALLTVFKEKVDVVQGPNGFSTMGVILGRLVPRCSDPSLNVRQLTLDSIYLMLRVALRYEGKDDNHREASVDAIPLLKDRLLTSDSADLLRVNKDMSKVLSEKIHPGQLTAFLASLAEGLLDSQSYCSAGASVVLNSVLSQRGGELRSKVNEVMESLLVKLSQVNNGQTWNGVVRAVKTLALHHVVPVVDCLLQQPMPLDTHVSGCWRHMGRDDQLLSSILTQLLDSLDRHVPYEEKPDPRDKDKVIKVAALMPVAITCALTCLCQADDPQAAVINNYPRLLAAMMSRVACSVGAKPPTITKEEVRDGALSLGKKVVTVTREVKIDPCLVSIDGCKQIIQATGDSAMLVAMDTHEVWKQLSDPEEYPEGFTVMARLMTDTQPEYVSKLVTQLLPVLSKTFDHQRIMAAAVLAEFIRMGCAGDLTLVDMLINSLLGRLIDSNHTLRKLCIRGLGNMASVGADQVQKYSTTVLSAMMAGMDDKDDVDDDITLEAMQGLSRVLAEVDESQVRAILINISLRIRPCFEKDKPAVRAAAIALFGHLSRFGDGPSKEPFVEQVHTNLVSLLLHLNDPDADVRKAAKLSLRQLGPLLKSEAVNKMLQKHLIDEASLHYGEFINGLTKVLIQDFEEKMNFYAMAGITFFKSDEPDIRSNAAVFTGFLLGNMPKAAYVGLSREHISSALVLLLKDSEPAVRGKAAEAISWLHDF